MSPSRACRCGGRRGSDEVCGCAVTTPPSPSGRQGEVLRLGVRLLRQRPALKCSTVIYEFAKAGKRHGVDRAGPPWQNGIRASFNGKFRGEHFLGWFRWRAEAKIIIESWRQYHNQVHLHSSPGYPDAVRIRGSALRVGMGIASIPRR